MVGNVGAPVVYGAGSIPKQSGLRVTITGLMAVRGSVLATRGAVEGGSGNASVRPWVMSRSICLASNEPQCPLRGCPLGPPSDTCSHDDKAVPGTPIYCWWVERVMHMVVSGADSVNFFNPWHDLFTCPDGLNGRLEDNALLSATLDELSDVMGCAQRRWVVDPHPRWNDNFVLSGSDVGTDRRLWRLTPWVATTNHTNNVTRVHIHGRQQHSLPPTNHSSLTCMCVCICMYVCKEHSHNNISFIQSATNTHNESLHSHPHAGKHSPPPLITKEAIPSFRHKRAVSQQQTHRSLKKPHAICIHVHATCLRLGHITS